MSKEHWFRQRVCLMISSYQKLRSIFTAKIFIENPAHWEILTYSMKWPITRLSSTKDIFSTSQVYIKLVHGSPSFAWLSLQSKGQKPVSCYWFCKYEYINDYIIIFENKYNWSMFAKQTYGTPSNNNSLENKWYAWINYGSDLKWVCNTGDRQQSLFSNHTRSLVNTRFMLYLFCLALWSPQ